MLSREDKTGNPSSHTLTEWLLSKFSIDSGLPERSSAEQSDMCGWLDDKFDTQCITSRGLANNLGLVLEGLLTRSECRRIIGETERLGYGRTSFPHMYRGNRRLQLDDADGLFS